MVEASPPEKGPVVIRGQAPGQTPLPEAPKGPQWPDQLLPWRGRTWDLRQSNGFLQQSGALLHPHVPSARDP